MAGEQNKKILEEILRALALGVAITLVLSSPYAAKKIIKGIRHELKNRKLKKFRMQFYDSQTNLKKTEMDISIIRGIFHLFLNHMNDKYGIRKDSENKTPFESNYNGLLVCY